MKRPAASLAGLLILVLHGPVQGGEAPAHVPGDERLGGATTVEATGPDAFSQPAANMPLTSRGDFFAGNAFFTQPWVTAPASTEGRDGLGPLFNLNACQGCHLNDGRGRAPRTGKPMNAALVRISRPVPPEPDAAQRAAVATHGVLPEPTYGTQIQPFGVNGLTGEPKPFVEWETVGGAYADGTTYDLRRPRLRFEPHADQPPLIADVQTSIRTAPPMIGLGLLEAIPESDIEAAADPEDADGDGISGRVNRIAGGPDGDARLGRFGWKANVPTIREQVAGAFHGDMGLTTPVLPQPPCEAGQAACLAAPGGGDPEVSEEILALIVSYSSRLAVPAQRDPTAERVARGRALFHEAQCAACHSPDQNTATETALPELADQAIHPYTDLLLHDMGPGLADGRPDHRANGREWRTPPLWGIGLTGTVSGNVNYLHDGRARTLAEAILWHGGEAEAAREAFRGMSAAEREALLAFLRSL